jgi:hypothetical protein
MAILRKVVLEIIKREKKRGERERRKGEGEKEEKRGGRKGRTPTTRSRYEDSEAKPKLEPKEQEVSIT